MRDDGHRVRLAATDLSNHVACRHLTALNLALMRGDLTAYSDFDPLVKILRERGRAHEEAFEQHLRASGRRVESGGENTLRWMAAGIDVITQAAFERDAWYGRADFLVRVDTPSPAWRWSYEVIDTKLSSETRAEAVLQLCVYSDLLAAAQGVAPEAMHIVRPGVEFPTDSFRYDEYAAIYRALREDLEQDVRRQLPSSAEPAAHCEVCNWRRHCEAEWRAADHLWFVADLGRLHRRELARDRIETLTALAQVPLPWPYKPERGSIVTYERLAQQARLQQRARELAVPPFELLDVEPVRGLSRLPAPSAGDVFLDFEGDPFIGEHGREFLFGWYTIEEGYKAIWATTDDAERQAFQDFISFVFARWEADPGMHVYHFAPYEPTALKRLAGRHGVCMDELDRLLRGRRLVDLYSITRQAVRVGIESYSIKFLEPVIGYTRAVALDETGPSVRAVRLCLQRGAPDVIQAAWREHVEAYNRGDCEATRALRDWLEAQRSASIAAGVTIARPPLLDGQRESVTEVTTAAALTAARLLEGVSADRAQRSADHEARWLLGHLMEWYRREHRVTWWEFFRLAETSDDERFEEQKAIAGLEHVDRFPNKKLPIDRYRYPAQDAFFSQGDSLRIDADTTLGTVAKFDPATRTIDVKKTGKTVDLHPTSMFAHKYIDPRPKDAALVRIGTDVAERGFPAAAQPCLLRDVLFRNAPRNLTLHDHDLRAPSETIAEAAIRLALALDGSVLPIQGPPGTGKTSTAARMIVALTRKGRRVGVTATSHKVIANLVSRVLKVAEEEGVRLRAALKCDEDEDKQDPRIYYASSASDADEVVNHVDVLGATAWQWARPSMRNTVDVLFIDEAGQMCLADAIAACEAARNLVLVGDPQQLEQPIQGTHPDGVGVSVLQHLVGGAQTISPDRGLLLDETHRLHPSICTFTSEQFYERKLRPAASVALQGIATSPFPLPGLYWQPVEHEGNQNRSSEEAEVVARVLRDCLVPGAFWTNAHGERRDLSSDDVLIVAPYNAHVAAIREALDRHGLGGVAVGTVDKFQGQEAAIAIYSMATSTPEDAPRGLAFLYDRHRLNVATSRARCVSLLIASPALLRPVCKTPAHLQMASALARYVELAHRPTMR